MRWLKWGAYLMVLGAGAALGLWLTVRLSSAGSDVEVPSVVGLAQDQAQFEATRSRLRFRVLSERYDLKAPRGQVVAQEPPAGTTTRRHRTLGVVVSKGVDRMPMPDLLGERMDQAQVKVRQAGLKLASVGYAHGVGEPHTVVAQDPPPDATVSREMEVAILVSLGPEPLTFVTPQLVGKPVGEARDSLRRYGLQLGAVRTVRAPGMRQEAIVSQNPAPGSPLTRRDVVQVSVNRP